MNRHDDATVARAKTVAPLTLGHYEVVRWEDGKETIVQTNIQTRDKARKALSIWKQREKTRLEPGQ